MPKFLTSITYSKIAIYRKFFDFFIKSVKLYYFRFFYVFIGGGIVFTSQTE